MVHHWANAEKPQNGYAIVTFPRFKPSTCRCFRLTTPWENELLCDAASALHSFTNFSNKWLPGADYYLTRIICNGSVVDHLKKHKPPYENIVPSHHDCRADHCIRCHDRDSG